MFPSQSKSVWTVQAPKAAPGSDLHIASPFMSAQLSHAFASAGASIATPAAIAAAVNKGNFFMLCFAFCHSLLLSLSDSPSREDESGGKRSETIYRSNGD
jgi:hypothetical protein